MAEIGLNFQLPVNTIPSITLISYIQSHITNTEKLMISQSMHGGKFSAIFATSKLYSPRPAHNWGIRRSYDSFVEFVKEEWEWKIGKSKGIYSSPAMRIWDSEYTWWKSMAEIKPFFKAAPQIFRKIGMKAFRLLRVLHENLHFTLSWQRTRRSITENHKSSSFIKNGNKWMMI